MGCRHLVGETGSCNLSFNFEGFLLSSFTSIEMKYAFIFACWQVFEILADIPTCFGDDVMENSLYVISFWANSGKEKKNIICCFVWFPLESDEMIHIQINYLWLLFGRVPSNETHWAVFHHRWHIGMGSDLYIPPPTTTPDSTSINKAILNRSHTKGRGLHAWDYAQVIFEDAMQTLHAWSVCNQACLPRGRAATW